ncbi:MAG: hypothetical protein IKF38_01675 [Clostridia bacterium]|nr:hypothetical protein [Clostridia bacterium]
MSELKKEFKSFMEDIEKNIKNKEDLDYVKNRTADFMNVVIDQMENVLNYKEEKISQIEKIQNDIEEKISNMQQDIADIEQEIYVEDEDLIYDEISDIDDLEELSDYDFEIVCPYCDNEFLIDLNQENSEVECPRCNNIIELEWSGNTDEAEDIEDSTCQGGHCSGCHGCGNTDIDDEEDM